MLGILLCCVMLLTLLPTTASADTIPGTMLEGKTSGSFFYLHGLPTHREAVDHYFLFLSGGDTQVALAGGDPVYPENMLKEPSNGYKRSSDEGGRGDCVFINAEKVGLEIEPNVFGDSITYFIRRGDNTYYKRYTDRLYRHSLGWVSERSDATQWEIIEVGVPGTYLIKESGKELYWNADTDQSRLSITSKKAELCRSHSMCAILLPMYSDLRCATPEAP